MYGKKLCLMSNIEPSLLLDQGKQDDNEAQCDRLRQVVTALKASTGVDGGGFIFGTCSGLHARMSPELVNFMYHLVSEPHMT
jgi:uroporphyrinogen decarboxylase